MIGVKAVSGLGLMIGIDIGAKDIKAVTEACLKDGLLILTAKDRLRLLPPLTIPLRDIDEGLSILAPAIRKAPKTKKQAK